MKKTFMLCAIILSAYCQTSAQDTKIRFFGQPELNFQKTSEKNAYYGNDPLTGEYILKDTTYDSRSNVNTKDFVLFVTSQLNEKVSVLAEANFYNRGNISFFEIQRLMVRYYHNDYFSVRVGKMFTPIGYWNNQYTLGLILQPTIQRPFAIRTGTDGGVLQYRDVGVQIEGDNMSAARLFYRLMVANGVGYFGSNDKRDNHYAVTGAFGAEPIDGLKVMASGQIDRIEKGKSSPNGSNPSLPADGFTALGLFSVAYMNPEKKYEFISELSRQLSSFNDEAIGDRYSTGFYAYAGYKVHEKITPYVLYDQAQAGEGDKADPYFAPIPVKVRNITLGVRYQISSQFITKLEVDNYMETYKYPDVIHPVFGVKLDDGFTQTSYTNRVRMQFAFMF